MRLLTVSTVFFSFLNTYSHSALFMLGLGTCPKINETLTDFDINRYLGVWYEQYRYFIVPEVSDVCTRINIKSSENGSTIHEISFYNTWTEDYDTVSGTAKIEEAEGEGKYALYFPGKILILKGEVTQNVPNLQGETRRFGPHLVVRYQDPLPQPDDVTRDLGDLSISYQVIDTDYDSYTVVASCNNKEGYYTRNVWIFTRDQLPSEDTLKKALSALSKKKLSVRFLHKIDHHSNCSHPEIDVNPEAEYVDDVDIETDAEEIE